MSKSNYASYCQLADCCDALEEANVSESYWGDDGGESNHWSATMGAMKEDLGRGLTDEEITVLSLSRCYGPTPSLQDHALMGQLWPSGNPKGQRMGWATLAARLREI